MANVILLDGEAREEDFVASEAITPGELVEHGGSDDIQAHSTASGTQVERIFVREQVENSGNGIDDDVPSGDTATVIYPEQGAKVQAFLAHGENVSEGDALESDGNGALQAQSSGDTIGYAAEGLNNTSGSASRIDITVA